MISQNFQHTTIRYATRIALSNHSTQLQFECFKSRDALVDVLKMSTRNSVNVCTRTVRSVGEVQKFVDCLQAKAKVARVADESQSIKRGLIIPPLPSSGPPWLKHKPDLFIVSDGLDFGAGLFGQASYSQH